MYLSLIMFIKLLLKYEKNKLTLFAAYFFRNKNIYTHHFYIKSKHIKTFIL